MGIKGLTNLLADECKENCYKEEKMSNYFSRKIAIDANMSIYQFLIGIRGSGMDLANEQGQVTSHLQGLLSRTTKMITQGLQPVYVFDGKPPELKSGELQKRREKAEQAKKEQEKAEDEGDEEKAIMLSKRTIRTSKEQIEEAKRLLRLMGVPIVEAPTEAEAQCAELCKSGVVYATATEDMDSLTFGTPTLIRHLTYSEARKQPIREYYLDKVLAGLGLTMDQFIDMCILCGCDYCPTIRGIGPKKALQYIKKFGTIEATIKGISDKKQYVVPEDFNFEQAREFFKKPEVTPGKELDLKWSDPDEAGLIEFMVKEKQFDEEKIKKAIEKIKEARKKRPQARITSFFSVKPKDPSASSSKTATPKKDAKAKAKKEKAPADKKRKRDEAAPSKGGAKKQKK